VKIALLTNIVSPHQLPLAEAIVQRIGEENYRYAYTESFHKERANMGWGNGEAPIWCKKADECSTFLRGADLVYCEERDLELFNERIDKGKLVFYVSERWFKPPIGIARLLHPRYFLMALKVVRMLRHASTFYYFPQGIHAARDMARLCGLFSGDLRCLFRAPQLEFERKPGGRIYLTSSSLQHPATTTTRSKRYCLDKMRMWGYFVEPSQHRTSRTIPNFPPPTPNSIHVLWVGRFLKWKRVDTIIRAVGELSTCSTCSTRFSLDIYGTGPAESRFKKLAAKYGDFIKFYPPVPISDVRRLMRGHDVYVLASNAEEGWGAALNEAMEEGVISLGTYEAGSSSSMLQESHLFHAGDWEGLSRLLAKVANGNLGFVGMGEWTAECAAGKLLSMTK